MLVDERYRLWVLRQVKDPVVRRVWDLELGKYDKRLWNEAIAPVQNKIGQLLIAPPLRNILGQVRSRIDAGFMMDHKRIFIANLSKGRLGEDKSSLLGAILVTMFQLAAMARTKLPEKKREDFFLFVDEFQNFTSDSFASILSEARKYRLCLTLSHQHISQVREEIRHAVFGNVGSVLTFRIGADDAELLSREFDNFYLPKQFTQLAQYHVCAKLLNGGEFDGPFMGVLLQPIGDAHGGRQNIVRRSRERYASRRHDVEEKIHRWLQP